MQDIKFSFAETKDLKSVQALLSDCDLPYQDVAGHLPHFILAQKDAQLIGVIGLELLGTIGLLRSLAVSSPYRGHGLAKALYARLLAYAGRKQIKTLYLLTLTAEGFFAKLGFHNIDRKNTPTILQGTEEFRNLCPDTAVCMVKDIEEAL